MMTQNGIERQKTSYRLETGRYVPRRYNSATRMRFLRDRRQGYLDRISGPPSDHQRTMIQALAQLEWSALQFEDENTLVALRESREHRRLMLKVLADFEATLQPPVRRVERRPPRLSDIVRGRSVTVGFEGAYFRRRRSSDRGKAFGGIPPAGSAGETRSAGVGGGFGGGAPPAIRQGGACRVVLWRVVKCGAVQ